MKRFAGRIAAVTGGASGIGDAITRRLLSEGARVAVLDINAELLAARQRDYGSDFCAIPGDVTDESTVAHFISECVRRFGGLDSAFNVAGAAKGGPIVDLSTQDWDFTVDLCLKGLFLSVKHEARHMVARGCGAIVNVASINAHVPSYAGGAFCPAKAGAEMLTKVAAIELAQQGVRVNALLPGLVDTPAARAIMNMPELKNIFLKRIPMGRIASPEEIAGPALFLASDDASYISGASLVVDGAWELVGYPNTRRFFEDGSIQRAAKCAEKQSS